jgi:2,4-dienoyl-CoA reductase (NADPH2)
MTVAVPPVRSERLLSPLILQHRDGSTQTLRNRVLMGSMHTGLEEHPDGIARLAAFYSARAAGGVALIVTGGLSPNPQGNMWAGMRTMSSAQDAAPHRAITDAVHEQGGLIALQLLHAGRYATHAQGVAPSALKSPLSPVVPKAMTEADIEQTLDDYARAAAFAQGAGYDGVEVMGAEGYLINQFMAPRSNQRTDHWGGSTENRLRFALEAVRRVRKAVGEPFILIYRLSMLDLVEGGCTWEEVVQLAKGVEVAGASIINPYVGWHEARVPTIATLVPRAAFVPLTARLKAHVEIPVVASNRINTPELAEAILADGQADLISMARPLLADAEFVNKASAHRSDLINTCIACNQGCLDEAFSGRLTTCMVNPFACKETELVIALATARKRVAVVGGGPGGLACAATAAERGHEVVLLEKANQLGGQFNLAKQIPGKEEYAETIRYFEGRLKEAGVQVKLGVSAEANDLMGYDEVVLSTGVRPRALCIDGADHPKVISYTDLIEGKRRAGVRVAIIGAGGIGFDVAEFLTEEDLPGSERARFFATWGIDETVEAAGGLVTPAKVNVQHEVWLLQRKEEALGKRLGRTTGWIKRALLQRRGVHMLGGVRYKHIDDEGLHIEVRSEPQVIAADTIVVCAGQESANELYSPLLTAGVSVHLIGGARLAGELDAMRAIDEGTRLAALL